MRFTYLVTVEVEDDLGMATECYDPDYFQYTDNDEDDETGEITARWLSPETKSKIIMDSRLGVDENLGNAIGNYSINYERQES
jgi:hypothetical protein